MQEQLCQLYRFFEHLPDPATVTPMAPGSGPSVRWEISQEAHLKTIVEVPFGA